MTRVASEAEMNLKRSRPSMERGTHRISQSYRSGRVTLGKRSSRMVRRSWRDWVCFPETLRCTERSDPQPRSCIWRSALLPKADLFSAESHVCEVPSADSSFHRGRF